MRTLLLKFVCWLLRITDKKSQFIVVVRSESNSYFFVNGKKATARNPITGFAVSTKEKERVDKILDEYFLLLNKSEGEIKK